MNFWRGCLGFEALSNVLAISVFWRWTREKGRGKKSEIRKGRRGGERGIHLRNTGHFEPTASREIKLSFSDSIYIKQDMDFMEHIQLNVSHQWKTFSGIIRGRGKMEWEVGNKADTRPAMRPKCSTAQWVHVHCMWVNMYVIAQAAACVSQWVYVCE